ncbi:YceI family protein [Phytoactinopolyspora halotolerans]|uniref:YceI family protein n=1 Tax=Phytoactinopolyspora halotolerans TaxID=1981512 RepID=A0A6L9RZU7_9ACTN|nr:YceI family protein [Phytoactinopolyspora halotolerans]NED98644.1 YceI family protein [Phytoactinopolyspora halotolerans]
MRASSKFRRRLIIAFGSLVGLTALVLGGTWFYINVIQDDAPEEFALDASDDEPAPPPDGLVLDGTWTVATGSEAGYRVDEVLNGLDNTVVGRTGDVTGEVTVADGTATAAEIVVDMTTVTTDSDSRDGQFRGAIMNTDDFPTSTFTLTDAVPVDELETAGGPVELTAGGELTVRDVTREVAVDLQMQLSGETVQVVGSIPITFADFEIDAPNLGFVQVEDEGLVEFSLTLAQGSDEQ